MRRTVFTTLLFFLFVQTAAATGYQEEWEDLHAALLKESMDGDLQGALPIFNKLARGLSASAETRPILAEALFQLGYGYLKQGNKELARVKLRECIRVSASERCRHLLSKLALEENGLEQLPTKWNFENREHSFVLVPGHGSVQVEIIESSSYLKWTLPPGPNPDVLVLSVKEQAGSAKKIRFAAHLERGERILFPVIEDRLGRRFTLKRGPLSLGPKPKLYEFGLREFVSIDETSRLLNPSDFYRMEFHERRATNTDQQDHSALLINWFEVL